MFEISPALFEPALRRIVGTSEYFDYRWTGGVSRMLDTEVERLGTQARTSAERLAIYRAAMTIIIETMDRVADSLEEMAEVYRAIETVYLALLRDHLGNHALRRDLLELVIWEDYGLTQRVEAFLRGLSMETAVRVGRELDDIITELRREELEYQTDRALSLRDAAVGPTLGAVPMIERTKRARDERGATE